MQNPLRERNVDPRGPQSFQHGYIDCRFDVGLPINRIVDVVTEAEFQPIGGKIDQVSHGRRRWEHPLLRKCRILQDLLDLGHIAVCGHHNIAGQVEFLVGSGEVLHPLAGSLDER